MEILRSQSFFDIFEAYFERESLSGNLLDVIPNFECHVAQLRALLSALEGFGSVLRKFIARVDHLAHEHSYQEASTALVKVEAL